MNDINSHITKVQNKLQQLLRQYEALKKENLLQLEQITELQTSKKNMAEQLDLLQQQNLLLKASIQQLAPADKKEMEQRINKYINNIDKCISILSR